MTTKSLNLTQDNWKQFYSGTKGKMCQYSPTGRCTAKSALECAKTNCEDNV